MIYEVKNLIPLNEVLKRLNNLRRWTEFVSDTRYDEISKQALNCCICYMLAVEAEANGIVIQWERFPKIAIYRAFQKAYVNYDVPEHILKEICGLGEIPFDKAFREATNKIILKETNEELLSWLEEGCGTTEEKLYKAATKVATFLELKELQTKLNGSFSRKNDQLVKELGEYENIPGFAIMADPEGDYFKVFKAISRLRNSNRWAAYSYTINSSVLGHLFDTAVFAYLMALEKGETEETSTKCFFMGIFHDIPEAFTRDIPSPVKDNIPGFRNLTEKYELEMMDKNVYPFISENVAKKIKKIMFEDSENSGWKTLMKGADYLSAISEIWRQFIGGTRDTAFLSAMEGHERKFQDGTAFLTENAQALFQRMKKDIKLMN